MSVRIHHLNCGSMCPPAKRLVLGEGSLFARAELVCHCLLIEPSEGGLILVETGMGTDDVARPHRRLGTGFVLAVQPALKREQTALAQIEALGHRAEDVTDIVLTHGHLDHAGGMSDFPKARVHLYAPELEIMRAPRGPWERTIYRRLQWAHGPDFHPHTLQGDTLLGFEAVRCIPGREGEDIWLLPVVGHTKGHSAVVVRADDRTLLHAGDAYFHRDQIAGNGIPVALGAFESLVDRNIGLRSRNLERLQELARTHPDVEVFCAHDPVEMQRVAARTAALA